ncbi:MAG: xanthine dehydrogenase family protein subunit M [Ilumatobacteraceae bacterium]|nr:xanthine dehydrogenase family protein subunit M [Ilumatobacteraceae bacterium]
MYPSRFKYETPSTVEEAIGLLHDGGADAKILAGGQSLIPMMKLRFAAPGTIVDINNIPGLDYMRTESDGTFRVGALVRHVDLERATELKDSQPTIAAAAHLVADPIVRTRGTFVGSLCHADPQGDWASCMVALDGSVVAQGPKGRRTIGVDEFVKGPFTTVLAPDELAVEAVVPKAQGVRSGGYLKLERRIGDFATAGVAVAIERNGDVVSRAGIGLTGVGSRTINAEEAAAAVVGQPLTPDTIERAGDLAAAISDPRSDHRGSADYKRHIVATFVTRLLTSMQPTREQSTEERVA